MLSASKVIFGPSLVVVSLIAAFYDIRLKKVPNWLISKALVASAALNLVFFATARSGYLFLPFIVGLLLASVVAVALWLLDFWKPGDVKLYFTLSTFLHPLDSGLFLKPLVVFIFLSILATLLEAAVLRNFSFKLNLNPGMLFPVALSPILSLVNINRLAVFFILFLLGGRLGRFKKPIIVGAALAFLISPLQVLQNLAFLSVFVLASSIKFKGHLPSAPFISASFIYLLVFHRI